jgi:hypothetical protein
MGNGVPMISLAVGRDRVYASITLGGVKINQVGASRYFRADAEKKKNKKGIIHSMHLS